MPIYDFQCTRCSKKQDVLRDFDHHRDPPTTEEGGRCTETQRLADGSEVEHTSEHTWEKKISSKIGLSFSGAWAGGGSGKGNWGKV